MKKTPQLRSLIENYKKMIPDEEHQSLVTEIDRLILHFHSQLSNFKPGMERAKYIHSLIDAENSKASDIKPTCQKGCGGCCHLEVEITPDDAEMLAETMLSKSIQIDIDRLRNQAARKRLDSAWGKGICPENRCVFLGENDACKIYEARPAVCRKHAVISPPEDCMKPGGSPIARVIPLNEIIISAMVNLENNEPKSFSKQLLESLERRLENSSSLDEVLMKEQNKEMNP